MYVRPQGNIVKEHAIDLVANGDYISPKGVFIRVETAGYLRYWPIENADDHPIEKWWDASFIFIDPTLIRRVSLPTLTTPSSDAARIYWGKGL